MLKKLMGLIPSVALVVVFISCDSDEKNARLQVWLTDAPGDYDEVNIDIQGVEIHSSESDNGKGWKSLDVKSGVYNLLELTNGLDTLIGELVLPAGKVSQIRLILGDDNSLKVGGQVYDLGTPSAQQSGLKLQVHETLAEGITYKILLDFDVAKSIVATGAGSYKLKPVIRTITEAESGAIKGIVSPVESTPAVYAINGIDTVATTFADENGKFLLRGVLPGTYKVTFAPASGFLPIEKADVAVQLGVVTDMGTVEIAHQ